MGERISKGTNSKKTPKLLEGKEDCDTGEEGDHRVL